MRSTFLTGAAFVMLMALPGAAYAADAAKEVSTAAAHAGMAAAAPAIGPVHMHLHHVVNCLVGAKGDGYDEKEANPCKAFGDGAIPDNTDAAMKPKLMAAVAKAQAGIKTDDLAAAQKDASDAAA